MFLHARRAREITGEVNLAPAIGAGQHRIGRAEQGNGRHVQGRGQMAEARVHGHASLGPGKHLAHAAEVQLRQYQGVAQPVGDAFGPGLLGRVAHGSLTTTPNWAMRSVSWRQ